MRTEPLPRDGGGLRTSHSPLGPLRLSVGLSQLQAAAGTAARCKSQFLADSVAPCTLQWLCGPSGWLRAFLITVPVCSQGRGWRWPPYSTALHQFSLGFVIFPDQQGLIAATIMVENASSSLLKTGQYPPWTGCHRWAGGGGAGTLLAGIGEGRSLVPLSARPKHRPRD